MSEVNNRREYFGTATQIFRLKQYTVDSYCCVLKLVFWNVLELHAFVRTHYNLFSPALSLSPLCWYMQINTVYDHGYCLNKLMDEAHILLIFLRLDATHGHNTTHTKSPQRHGPHVLSLHVCSTIQFKVKLLHHFNCSTQSFCFYSHSNTPIYNSSIYHFSVSSTLCISPDRMQFTIRKIRFTLTGYWKSLEQLFRTKL